MITAFQLALFCAIKYSNAIVIEPDTDTSGLGITVNFTTDSRGINEITSNNKWKLFQSYDNPLTEWYVNCLFHSQFHIKITIIIYI